MLILVFALSLLSIGTISHNAFSDTVTNTILVGSQPHSIAVNPNTNRIYVADGNGVEVIDGISNTVVGTIPTGVRQIAINPTTNLIYALYGTSTIEVIDGETNQIVTSIGTSSNTQTIAVNSATNKIYVTWTNWHVKCPTGGIQVINGTSNTVIKSTAIGCDHPLLYSVVNPTTNKVYVFDQFDSGVQILDGTTDDFVGKIPGAKGNQATVNPTTDKLYVTNENYMQIIDLSTNTVVDTMNFGTSLGPVAVNPATNKIYVGDFNSDGRGTTVYVIDGLANKITQTVTVGTNPSSITANPITNDIYVANQLDNSVSIIDGNNQPVSTINLNINSADLSGNTFDGMWVEIWQNGEIVQEGPTPFSTEIQSDANYEIFTDNWQNITFDHWEDGGTDARRPINISEDSTITAFFNTNNPPVAGDDSAETTINNPVTIDVLANDSDPDGDPLTVDSITIEPEHGSVTINEDNTITYTPDFAFLGSDSFDYQISDGNGGTDTAMVPITVNAVSVPKLPM